MNNNSELINNNLDIKTSTYIDPRYNKTMFQMTMTYMGVTSSITTDYTLLVKKDSAKSELCSLINKLCDMVYKS